MNLLTLKQARATLKLIASAGKKLDERIHLVGCSGIGHYLEKDKYDIPCGDTTVLSELVHAMPRSARGNALKHWITKHCNVKWDTKAGPQKKGAFKKASKSEPVQGDLDAAIATPFYIKPDTESPVFNPIKRAESFIAAFEGAVKAGKITREDWVAAKDAIAAA